MRAIFPDSNQNGTCTLNVISREYPQGAETVSSDINFDAARKYISTKSGGKLFAFKLSGNAAFTAGAWLLDIIFRGRR